MNSEPSTRSIYVLSGGSGHTARTLLNAALAQFHNPPVEIVHKAHIRRVRDAERIVRQAAEQGAILCHSLVAPKIREAVHRLAVRLDVPTIDVLGPAVSLLADHLGILPAGRAGLVRELHKEQFDRIEAVDFTLAHDDGRRIHELDQADVVLVGASRTSKSATCFYLAARGFRAANIPLMLNHPVPEELVASNHPPIIGLTMNAARLCKIRQTRLERITDQLVNGYADAREVAAELRYAAELMRRHKWPCIDVSYKATEEVASEIIELLSRSSDRAGI